MLAKFFAYIVILILVALALLSLFGLVFAPVITGGKVMGSLAFILVMMGLSMGTAKLAGV